MVACIEAWSAGGDSEKVKKLVAGIRDTSLLGLKVRAHGCTHPLNHAYTHRHIYRHRQRYDTGTRHTTTDTDPDMDINADPDIHTSSEPVNQLCNAVSGLNLIWIMVTGSDWI